MSYGASLLRKTKVLGWYKHAECLNSGGQNCLGEHFPPSQARCEFAESWQRSSREAVDFREERSMDQCRSRLKLPENFERHWSILISGEIHMDQSSVHTFSWGNSYGPMVLKVLLKFPSAMALVHGWLFPGLQVFWRNVCRKLRAFRGSSSISAPFPVELNSHVRPLSWDTQTMMHLGF